VSGLGYANGGLGRREEAVCDAVSVASGIDTANGDCVAVSRV